MNQHKSRRVLAGASGLWTALLSAVPVLAASARHPNWTRFYDAAEHWHAFSITRELGQLLAIILGKILDFFEGSLYNMVFQHGGEFFEKINLTTVFAGNGHSSWRNFWAILTALLVAGLVSYGFWILLHTEQTSNTPRYFVRQIIALIGTIWLVPAMLGSFWNLAGNVYAASSNANTSGIAQGKTAGKRYRQFSSHGVSASASCINDNVVDWYWIAGKGGILAGDSKDGKEKQKEQNDAASDDDSGSDTKVKNAGFIEWKALYGPGTKRFYTCNPYLGGCGWEAIAPMQYMTDSGISDYNETATAEACDNVVADCEKQLNDMGKKAAGSLEYIRIQYKEKYYNNLKLPGDGYAKSKGKGQISTKKDHQDDGEIEDSVAENVFTRTEDGTKIKAAKGDDGPLKVLFKNGLGNPPWYRYTINWIPLLIEEFALAAFYFAITLKTLRILFDLVITGIVAPLFVATDFWGESGQKTKTIYRSIINGYVSICALAFEAELFEIFCCVISNQTLSGHWFTDGFFKAMEYLAIGYIGLKGADIFKKLNLDVDTSEPMKVVGQTGQMAGRAVAGTARGVAAVAGASGMAALSAHDMRKARNAGKEDGKAGAPAIGGDTSPDDTHNGPGGAAKKLPTAQEKFNQSQTGNIPGRRSERKKAVRNGAQPQGDLPGAGTTGGKAESKKTGPLGQPSAVPGVPEGGIRKPSVNEVNRQNSRKQQRNGRETAPAPVGNALRQAEAHLKENAPAGGAKATDQTRNPAGRPGQTESKTNSQKSGSSKSAIGDAAAAGAAGSAFRVNAEARNGFQTSPQANSNGTGKDSTGARAKAKSGESRNPANPLAKALDQASQPGKTAKGDKELADPAGTKDRSAQKPSKNGVGAGEIDTLPDKTGAGQGADAVDQANDSANSRDQANLTMAGAEGQADDTAAEAADSSGSLLSQDNPLNQNDAPDGVSGDEIGNAELADFNGDTSPMSSALNDTGTDTASGDSGASVDANSISGQREVGGAAEVEAESAGESGESSGSAANTSNNQLSSSGTGGATSGGESTESESGGNISGQRQVGFVSPHSIGQAGRIGAQYQGKGKLGQATADVYGHEMAYVQNAFAIHDIAQSTRQVKVKDGQVQYKKNGKVKKTHVKLGKTMAGVTKGYVRAKQAEYSGYLRPRDSDHDTAKQYQQIGAVQDNRPQTTGNEDHPGN